MAIARTISLDLQITADSNFTASGRWDGYSCVIARDFPEGPFQGYMLDWGVFENQDTINTFQNQQYSGYTTNWGIHQTSGTVGAFENEKYAGYTTNWGQYDDQPIEASFKDVDMNTIVDYPKDQIIYYKLKGWNNQTQQYESWIISHNVTGRPALDGGLFDPDPGREPPNVERDVFKTPPSGNTLSNIIIVARWIE